MEQTENQLLLDVESLKKELDEILKLTSMKVTRKLLKFSENLIFHLI